MPSILTQDTKYENVVGIDREKIKLKYSYLIIYKIICSSKIIGHLLGYET